MKKIALSDLASLALGGTEKNECTGGTNSRRMPPRRPLPKIPRQRPPVTTLAMGEEEVVTTLAMGEEDVATTLAMGEE